MRRAFNMIRLTDLLGAMLLVIVIVTGVLETSSVHAQNRGRLLDRPMAKSAVNRLIEVNERNERLKFYLAVFVCLYLIAFLAWRSKRRIGIAGSIVFVLMGLYPNWTEAYPGIARDMGYFPICCPPSSSASIDVRRLFIQWFILLLITLAAYKMKDSSEKKEVKEKETGVESDAG